jgi:FG-GAP repeat
MAASAVVRVLGVAALLVAAGVAAGASGKVRSFQKISDLQGGLGSVLGTGDRFGRALCTLGDVDGDGTDDIAVGALQDDDGGTDCGAVYVLFLRPNGTVKAEQKISAVEGNLQSVLDSGGFFGRSVAAIGDLDRDTVPDLAVGASSDGPTNRGAVYVLFLHRNGTVKSEQKISDTEGNFQGRLSDQDKFGSSVTGLGEFNGDATLDLAVGAVGDGGSRGAVYMLFLHPNGTVKSDQKISDTSGNFQGVLVNSDLFGAAVAVLSDINGDGTDDLAVGAYGDDDNGTARGAVYVLFLHPNATVKAAQKISDTQGNFQGGLSDLDYFGVAVANVGDIDGDRVQDLAVGAQSDNDGGASRGAVYVMFLDPSGTVKAEQKISDTQGNFQGLLGDGDWFGSAVTVLSEHRRR